MTPTPEVTADPIPLDDEEREVIRRAVHWFSFQTHDLNHLRVIRRLREKFPCSHTYTVQERFCDVCGEARDQ